MCPSRLNNTALLLMTSRGFRRALLLLLFYGYVIALPIIYDIYMMMTRAYISVTDKHNYLIYLSDLLDDRAP